MRAYGVDRKNSSTCSCCTHNYLPSKYLPHPSVGLKKRTRRYFKKLARSKGKKLCKETNDE